MGLPADASGAFRPNPQATTKLAPRPSSLKGYKATLNFIEKRKLQNANFRENLIYFSIL
jgi:hypothetical protein